MSSNNPLYPGSKAAAAHNDNESVLKPPVNQSNRTALSDRRAADNDDKAADLIRQKLAAIYGDEPDAKLELAEAEMLGPKHSRHQQFMSALHVSGKPMTQIQAEWHQYYQHLDDAGKHEVWQEFYAQSAQSKQPTSLMQPAAVSAHNPLYPLATGHDVANDANHTNSTISIANIHPEPESTATTVAFPMEEDRPGAIKRHIRQTIGSRGKLQAKHHLQSLLFGLGFGALVLVIVLFSFFNEVIIAPFIQPSRTVSATPIIVSPDGITAATGKDEVIIPKINVEIPLDFSSTSTDEKEFEAALDKGVAHYPTTALPGQKGNASFFGHSSNNIFNPGKYKFAFVLLNELVPGDTFYITYNGTAFAYQVYDKQIVEATNVGILNPVADKSATAMLVTCDPPGTSLRRLAVWGEQVSPNPSNNAVATSRVTGTQAATTDLPGNGPTLLGRIRGWITGQ